MTLVTISDKNKAALVVGKPSRAKTPKPEPAGDGYSDPEWGNDRWSSRKGDDIKVWNETLEAWLNPPQSS